MPFARRIVLAVSVAILSGCTPPNQPASDPPMGQTCAAERYRHLIGQAVENSAFQQVENLRIIPPNAVVTLDYNPARLNVETDATGVVSRLSCG